MNQSSPFIEVPNLETAHYKLRGLRLEDAEVLFNYLSNRETMKYITPEPVRTVKEAEEQIDASLKKQKNHTEIHWVIIQKHSGRVVGTFCFHKVHNWHMKAEMGVVIGKKYQQQGVMTEVLDKTLIFGFETLGLNRIVCDIFADNEGSERLLTNYGFKKEGILRQTDFDGQVFHDTVVFSMLKEEYYIHSQSTYAKKD